MADPNFQRGARRAPLHKLLTIPLFEAPVAAPQPVAWIPQKLDMWGNDQYGDCVTAEEAFAKATYQPEIFIPVATVVAWARARGYRDGADLPSVLDSMQRDGFKLGSQQYNDGPYQAVDYSDEAVLQAALMQGPVKIAIDANALPSGAGNKQGWFAFGGRPGQFPNTDHCVAICGFGPADFLAGKLGVQTPSGAPATCYLLYTWSTIGFVDHNWLMSTCVEAYVRNPTTVGNPPLTPPAPPTPTPTPPPTPTPTPTPTPAPGSWTINVQPITATVSASGPVGAPPPWLAILLALLCKNADKVPAPWNAILKALCPPADHGQQMA